MHLSKEICKAITRKLLKAHSDGKLEDPAPAEWNNFLKVNKSVKSNQQNGFYSQSKWNETKLKHFFFQVFHDLDIRASHWRRYENDAVASDEEHGDVPLGRPVNLFVRFFVDLHGRDGLLHVAEDHVQMLIVCLKEEKT